MGHRSGQGALGGSETGCVWKRWHLSAMMPSLALGPPGGKT